MTYLRQQTGHGGEQFKRSDCGSLAGAGGGFMSNQTDLSIRSVLFATDLSDGFGVPLRYASQIASKYNAKLFLVHVADSSVANPMSSLSSELREIAASANTELKRISESVLAAKGVSGEVFVRSGNVPDVVFAVQQECKADLVVVASTGKKPGHGRAAGSIAEVILRSAPCMVLAIGPHVEERPYHRGTTILFPTDLSPRSAEAIPVAASLSSYPGTLLLVHICAPYPSGGSMDHEMASPQRLREFAESARASGLQPEYSVRQGQVSDEIVSFAKERNADFIVMSVHSGDLDDGTRLHGTVSDVIREADCPVLTVPQHLRS